MKSGEMMNTHWVYVFYLQMVHVDKTLLNYKKLYLLPVYPSEHIIIISMDSHI